MTRTRTVMLVVLVCCLAISPLAAPVAAQADADTDTSDAGTDADEPAGSYSVDLDDETRITQADYDGENKTLTITIKNTGSNSERVLLAQVIERGADRMAFRDMQVFGESSRTVELRNIPNENGDPAVMAATETSLEDGQIQWIPTGEKPLSETVSLSEGVGIGIVTMAGMTAIMAYRRKTKAGDEPQNPFDDSGVF